MHYSVEINEEAPSDWNDFLLKSETGTIYNIAQYAEYAPVEGFKPKFLRLVDASGNIVLQNLLLEHNPGIRKIPRPFQKIYKKFRIVSRWNYGPVADSPDAIMAFFEHLKKTQNRIYGIAHPFSEIGDVGFQKQKWGTFLIDLHKTKEELFNNIEKNSGRKNIERSVERNVIVEELNEKSLVEYIDLFNKTKMSSDREETAIEDMLQCWRLLKPAGFSGFLAKRNDIPVGGLLFSFFNSYINEWGVARSQADYEEKLYSQDLIKWKIIEWGLEHKMKWYDLSGFNPEPTTEKEKGILRYKEKWGGKKYDQWIIKN